MFTACQLHYPPSSFFHSPAAPLRFPRSSSAILSTFANSVAATRATRASANRNWPGTCLREKLLCLPTRTGLKAVKDSASASPEENLKGTTKRDTRLGSSTFLRSPFVVSVLPSFPRIVSLRTAVLLPPPRFFRLPTFAPIPPTSSTLRVTNESPRGLRIDDPLGLDSGRGNR